jgi:hypothetical protein
VGFLFVQNIIIAILTEAFERAKNQPSRPHQISPTIFFEFAWNKMLIICHMLYLRAEPVTVEWIFEFTRGQCAADPVSKSGFAIHESSSEEDSSASDGDDDLDSSMHEVHWKKQSKCSCMSVLQKTSHVGSKLCLILGLVFSSLFLLNIAHYYVGESECLPLCLPSTLFALD